MSDVSIIVPYRSDGGRRDELWEFTQEWLATNHPTWQVTEGESPDGPFSRGAAINDAAQRAILHENPEVLVIHDADTLCNPLQLLRATDHAYASKGVCYPYEVYTYLDEYSSNQLMANEWGWRFVAPERHPQHCYQTTVRWHHVSGAMAVSREAWEKVGGFVALEGWGAEDLIMHTLFKTFGGPVEWLRGSAYHLYHSANRNSGDEYDMRNHGILSIVQALSYTPEKLREWLQEGDHPIPSEPLTSLGRKL